MLTANYAKIGRRLFVQITPAFGANRRLRKLKKRVVAEPAAGGKSGTTYSV
jgi:hypothetical protein